MLIHHTVMLQGGNDGHGERPRNRGDQVYPLTCEIRGENRQSHNGAFFHTRFEGITIHHLGILQNLGPTNIESSVHLRWEISGFDQVIHHVTHCDGLNQVSHPLWGSHYWQHIGEVANHFKTG